MLRFAFLPNDIHLFVKNVHFCFSFCFVYLWNGHLIDWKSVYWKPCICRSEFKIVQATEMNDEMCDIEICAQILSSASPNWPPQHSLNVEGYVKWPFACSFKLCFCILWQILFFFPLYFLVYINIYVCIFFLVFIHTSK